MYIGVHVQYRYSCQSVMKRASSDRFSYTSFQWGAELFRADRQTDRQTDGGSDEHDEARNFTSAL
jgi:hypothetical protein